MAPGTPGRLCTLSILNSLSHQPAHDSENPHLFEVRRIHQLNAIETCIGNRLLDLARPSDLLVQLRSSSKLQPALAAEVQNKLHLPYTISIP
jgi:hypothetical protein